MWKGLYVAEHSHVYDLLMAIFDKRRALCVYSLSVGEWFEQQNVFPRPA